MVRCGARKANVQSASLQCFSCHPLSERYALAVPHSVRCDAGRYVTHIGVSGCSINKAVVFLPYVRFPKNRARPRIEITMHIPLKLQVN